MLVETNIADAKRCSTLVVHADTPHRNILIASLTQHLVALMVCPNFLIHFMEKVGLDVFVF